MRFVRFTATYHASEDQKPVVKEFYLNADRIVMVRRPSPPSTQWPKYPEGSCLHIAGMPPDDSEVFVDQSPTTVLELCDNDWEASDSIPEM